MTDAPEHFLDARGEVIHLEAPQREGAPILSEWDAGEDDFDVPPRGWLLGNTFCRRFLSALIADGGVGKTALRVTQLLALATGRPLTGEHVFQRSRVLLVSLEDDRDELRRRVRAAMLHHGIKHEDIRGWLFLATPKGLRLAEMKDGSPQASTLEAALRRTIRERKIDVVSIDPFVKAHGMEENSNNAIDFVCILLAKLAMEYDCAVDAPHHVNKLASAPGDANRSRGASAFKDAARLVYTLAPMSEEEASRLGIKEPDRQRLIRLDTGKVNITPRASDARWFRLIGVRLGNGTDTYPHGDEVQTVEPWTPPDMWKGLNPITLNAILTEMDKGLPDGALYSDHNKAEDRAAWLVVQRHLPELTEGQAREIIRTWVKNSVLESATYHDKKARKDRKGLRVNHTKRPT